MKILFIADPVEKLKPAGDSTLALAQTAIEARHEVYWATENDIRLHSAKVVVRALRLQTFTRGSLPSTESAKVEAIEKWKCIFIRKDPPFDSTYLRLCWLLALAEDKTYFMNRPSRLLRYHEKLLPIEAQAQGFLKPTDLIPTFLDDREAAKTYFTRKKVSEVIAKPLLGFGGSDVLKESVSTYFSHPEGFGPRETVVQPFMKEVAQGDRRVFFLNGKILAHFVRMPKPGGFISNLAQGGSAVSRPLGKAEKEALLRLGKFLKRAKIHLAGADVIGTKISEVNITSPTGLRSLEVLDLKNYALEILRFAETQARR